MTQAVLAPDIISRANAGSILQRLQSSARHFAQSERVGKIRDHKLTQTFMNAAQKSGLKTAFKLAAAGTAGALGANAYGVALAGGAGVTFAEAIRDYAAWRKEQENKSKGFWGVLKNFFSFVGDNKATYTGKLLKNTGIGFLGAEIGSLFAGRETMIQKAASYIPGLPELGQRLVRAGDFITDKIFPSARAAELSRAAIERINNSADPIMSLVQEKSGPIRNIAGTNIENGSKIFDTKGWNATALEDLKAAKQGKAWALQNIAHYAANGLHGVPRNFEYAREMAQEAAAKGSKLSAQFLRDLDGVAGAGVDPTAGPRVSAPVSEASIPAIAPQPLNLATLDTKGWSAKALEDLKAARAGRSWALQNMAHYAANGLNGVPQNFEFARELAQQAGARGSKLSAGFLKDLDGLSAAKNGLKTAAHAIGETAVTLPAMDASDTSALAEVTVKADSNICHFSRDVGDMKVEGLSKSEFKLACENPDTVIAPNDYVRLQFDHGGEALAFNGEATPQTVRQIQKRLAQTFLENPEADKAVATRAARLEIAPEPSL